MLSHPQFSLTSCVSHSPKQQSPQGISPAELEALTAAGISSQELLRSFGSMGSSPGWVLRTGRRPRKGHYSQLCDSPETVPGKAALSTPRQGLSQPQKNIMSFDFTLE